MSDDDLHQVTVNFTIRAWACVEEEARESGDSLADTINRAVQIHHYVESKRRHGWNLWAVKWLKRPRRMEWK